MHMQSTADVAHIATHVLEGVENTRPQGGPNPQLSLPSGPGALLRGGLAPRRERTSEDRAWYSGQLRDIRHSRLTDKVVFERLVFYASLRPERVAFPSVGRMAREALVSERTVQYSLRRLETVGLIACISPGRGRTTSVYRVLDPTDCASVAQSLRVSGATGAPKGFKSRSKETEDLDSQARSFAYGCF